MKLSTETWLLVLGAGVAAAYYYAKSQAATVSQSVNPQTGLTGAQTQALGQANQTVLANAASGMANVGNLLGGTSPQTAAPQTNAGIGSVSSTNFAGL
jgi:hypothetical protein